MPESLQQLLDRVGNPVSHLRNNPGAAYFPPIVPGEFTSWRLEQQAWRESAVLFDQTHHMDTVTLSGPGAMDLIAATGVNSVANFAVNRAKQYVAVSPEGYFIGDGILFREEAEQFVYVGRPHVRNWLSYHAETGGYNVDIDIDPRSPINSLGKQVTRRDWRFQIQGPAAWSIIEKLNGGPVPDLPFFHMSTLSVGGATVRTLRHGMSGVPGLELWGPHEDYERVRSAIMEAGKEFGLRAAGARAYPTNTLESGWIATPLPAIYTGEALRGYREWLPAASPEGANPIAGSFVSDDIRDYYLRPWELGYGSFIKYDHDFIGKEALQAVDLETQRKKVTLAWNPDDVAKLFANVLGDSAQKYKHFDLPMANYGFYNFDRVLDGGDAEVGLSLYTGYSSNENRALSLAVVDPDVPIGTEVSVVWGEPDGGTRKLTVEPHEQFAVRAIVSPAPYSVVAREQYQKGWRTASVAPAV